MAAAGKERAPSGGGGPGRRGGGKGPFHAHMGGAWTIPSNEKKGAIDTMGTHSMERGRTRCGEGSGEREATAVGRRGRAERAVRSSGNRLAVGSGSEEETAEADDEKEGRGVLVSGAKANPWPLTQEPAPLRGSGLPLASFLPLLSLVAKVPKQNPMGGGCAACVPLSVSPSSSVHSLVEPIRAKRFHRSTSLACRSCSCSSSLVAEEAYGGEEERSCR